MKPKKKILHIMVLPKLAGSQRMALSILRGLPDGDYEKWVMMGASTPGDDEAEAAETVRAFRAAGVRVVFSGRLRRAIGPRDFGALADIWRLCRRERFDIVHTHSTKPGIVGRIAATLAGVPFVVHTVHGLAFHDFVRFPRWQFYWACEMFASLFCRRIVMVNRYYGRYFGWYRHKISTIYNGVSLPRVEPRVSRGDGSRILFVGRLDEAKDPLTLLRAARIVIGCRPEAHFTLAGDGELYDECARFVHDNSLADNVTLAGWQSDTAPFYARADIFAMSSIYESFGLIFLEAGNRGLPIVATRVEGVPEVVADGESGLLCPPRDPGALADAIVRLMDDDALRRRIGAAARRRARLFTEQKMVDAYVALYESGGGSGNKTRKRR